MPLFARAARARPTPVADDAIVALVDAVLGLVQVVGAYAHDVPAHPAADTRDAAERWRRQLAYDGPVSERDWGGVVRFAAERRRAEHTHVVRAEGELRDALWMLARGLHAISGDESAADAAGEAALRRLADAVARPEPDALRQAARDAVAELGELAVRRAARRDTEVRRLGAQLAELGAALDAARRDGATDPLTGLGNRRAFDEALERACAAHGLWRRRSALVLFDLDGLKGINDTLGHQAGDAAIEAAAGQLARAFLSAGDVLARIGGDEFAVVLPDVAPADARRLAERAVAGMEAEAAALRERWAPSAPAGVGDASCELGLSAGVAALAPGDTPAVWAARADAALYAAKRAGKGRVVAADAGA